MFRKVDGNYKKFKMAIDMCSAAELWLKLYQDKVLFATILLVFSPIAILLNLTLIASFIATRQITKNTSNVLIFLLSLCDLITGTVSMPLTSSILLDMTANDVCIKAIILFISSSNSSFSVLLTVFLAMDRYLHMSPSFQTRPSKLEKMLRKQNLYFFIVVVLILFISAFVIAAFHISAEVTLSIVSIFTGLLAINVLAIACLYIKGYLRIRRFVDNNPVYNEPGGSTRTTPDYVRKLYKTVLILIMLALIQYTPLCLAEIIAISAPSVKDEFSTDATSYFSYFYELASLLSNSGCFTNCLVILYFNKEAKTWIFTKIGVKRNAEQLS